MSTTRPFAVASSLLTPLLASTALAQPVPEAQMQRYCQGEAAGEFNTRPNYITTDSVRRTDKAFIVHGAYDDAGNRQEFQCQFSLNGEFSRIVMLESTSADAEVIGPIGDVPTQARQACLERWGIDARIYQVSALRPGYWEIILQDNQNPTQVACTVTGGGDIQNWVVLR